MGTLLVVVFKDVARVRDGARLLRALHAQGALTLYAMATVAPATRGHGFVALEPVADGEGGAGPAVGAALGALVSLLGGPTTAAARTTPTGLLSTVRDMDEAGLDAGFLEQAVRDLRPWGGAVIAEADEGIRLHLDARERQLGGRVFRHQIGSQEAVNRCMGEMAILRSEAACLQEQCGLKTSSALVAIRRARAEEVRRALRNARALANALRREGAAKASVLRAQAAGLEGEARVAIERRAAAIGAAFAAQVGRLERRIKSESRALLASTNTGRTPRATRR